MVRAVSNKPTGYGSDRVVLLVRDPYWLQLYWEITPPAVKRTEKALEELALNELNESNRWIPTCILESNKAAENAK